MRIKNMPRPNIAIVAFNSRCDGHNEFDNFKTIFPHAEYIDVVCEYAARAEEPNDIFIDSAREIRNRVADRSTLIIPLLTIDNSIPFIINAASEFLNILARSNYKVIVYALDTDIFLEKFPGLDSKIKDRLIGNNNFSNKAEMAAYLHNITIINSQTRAQHQQQQKLDRSATKPLLFVRKFPSQNPEINLVTDFIVFLLFVRMLWLALRCDKKIKNRSKNAATLSLR